MVFPIPFLDSWLSRIRPALYDDVVDRLNYYATTIILLFLSILVSAKQCVGTPVQCFMSKGLSANVLEFAESFCSVQGFYYIPHSETLSQNFEERNQQKLNLGYYQWMPMCLSLQALLFYIPYFFWKSLNFRTGIKLKSLIQRAVFASNADLDKRDEELKKVGRYLQESLRLRDTHFSSLSWRQKISGAYVTCLYIFTKFLYLVNIVIQFLILSLFLGSSGATLDTGTPLWGVQVLSDLLHGKDWQTSGRFPRSALCDFEVRAEISNIKHYTVECVLMINMFNEKIFIFLWFWLVILGLVTGLNFLYWCVISFTGICRVRFLLSCLLAKFRPKSTGHMQGFAQSLPLDAILVLRFIESHVDDWALRVIASELWREYYEENVSLLSSEQSAASAEVDLSAIVANLLSCVITDANVEQVRRIAKIISAACKNHRSRKLSAEDPRESSRIVGAPALEHFALSIDRLMNEAPGGAGSRLAVRENSELRRRSTSSAAFPQLSVGRSPPHIHSKRDGDLKME